MVEGSLRLKATCTAQKTAWPGLSPAHCLHAESERVRALFLDNLQCITITLSFAACLTLIESSGISTVQLRMSAALSLSDEETEVSQDVQYGQTGQS